MQATRDFTAHIDGTVYQCKKGEAFAGTRHALYLLEKEGLIAKVRPMKKKGETK